MNNTPDSQQTERTWRKNDTISLIFLISLAYALGIYLIISTVLISKDGVLYIEQAREFEHDSAAVLKGNTPGYPILLFAIHKVIGLFGDNWSLQEWINMAQGVTLLFRLLALIPLYLIGKRMVGSKDSSYAMLIFILLPYPAHMSCELTREWPYVFFLTMGMLLLLKGTTHITPWTFGAAGLITGLSYIIRPEGAQLIMLGVLWLLFKLARPEMDLRRAKVSVALLAILAGFAIPVTPYVIARGRILPEKVRELFLTSDEAERNVVPPGTCDNLLVECPKAGLLNEMGEGFYKLGEKISENLLYFFALPMLVGIYLHLKKSQHSGKPEKFFITAFVAFNIAAPVILYQHFHYMSRRHVLPVLLIGIFYIPAGLHAISDRLESGLSKRRQPSKKNTIRWFTILLSIGLVVCLPKLIRPSGADKRGYRDAAQWLKKNTDTAAIVAVMDPRISFYAERKGLFYENDIPAGVDYVVMITSSSDKAKRPAVTAQEVYSVGVRRRDNEKKKVVIYKITRSKT